MEFVEYSPWHAFALVCSVVTAGLSLAATTVAFIAVRREQKTKSMIEFKCSQCGGKVAAPAWRVGHTGMCPICGNRNQVDPTKV